MNRRLGIRPFLLLLLTLGLWPVSAALADEPDIPPLETTEEASTPMDRPTFAKLIAEHAIGLMDKGNLKEACPKLEISVKAVWDTDRALKLAECYEKTGQLASAWAKLRECESRMRGQSPPDPRADDVLERITELYPKVPRLIIAVVPEANVMGLVITRNGVVIDKSQWNVSIPVDPGKQVIVASAPGRVSYKWDGQAVASGGTKTVPIFELDFEPTALLGPMPVLAPRSEPVHPRRWAAIGGGLLTFVSAGIGATFLSTIESTIANAENICRIDGEETTQCKLARKSAIRAGKDLPYVIAASFTGSLVFCTVGAFLWFTTPVVIPPEDRPPSKPSSGEDEIEATLVPLVGPTMLGVGAVGRF